MKASLVKRVIFHKPLFQELLFSHPKKNTNLQNYSLQTQTNPHNSNSIYKM